MPNRQGSPNKNKQFLLKRLQDMYGEDFDPIIKCCENAMEMQKKAALGGDEEFAMRKECVSAWEKVAQYVTPKLKAVEVSGVDGGAIKVKENIKIEFVNLDSQIEDSDSE